MVLCVYLCVFLLYIAVLRQQTQQRKYFQHRSRRIEEAKGTKFFAKVIVYNARGTKFFAKMKDPLQGEKSFFILGV